MKKFKEVDANTHKNYLRSNFGQMELNEMCENLQVSKSYASRVLKSMGFSLKRAENKLPKKKKIQRPPAVYSNKKCVYDELKPYYDLQIFG